MVGWVFMDLGFYSVGEVEVSWVELMVVNYSGFD